MILESPKIKSDTVSAVSPSISHEVMGPDAMILVFSIYCAILSKSLIQFSVDGRGCVPSLLFDLRPNYGGGNEDNGDLLQKKVTCTQGLNEAKAGIKIARRNINNLRYSDDTTRMAESKEELKSLLMKVRMKNLA